MSINLNKLHSLSRDELVVLAQQHGLTVHWKAKPETIVTQIIEKVNEKPAVVTQAQATIVKPEHHNTADDVEEALESLKAKAPRLRSFYPTEDTWHFKYVMDNGRVLYEESGNLNIPLKMIVRRATVVSRGPLVLRGLNNHFDQLPVGGNNAYTNTVIA